MDNSVIYICFGIAILIIVAIFLLRYFLKGKDEANKFLDDLSEEIYKMVTEAIKEIDISQFKDLADFMDYIIDKVYTMSWKFVEEKIKECEGSDLLSALAKKILTKEYIEKFIKALLDSKDISSFAQSQFLFQSAPEAIEEIEKIDKEIEEEMSNTEEYYQNDDEVELDDAKEVTEYSKENYTEEELEKIKEAGFDQINPPVEEDSDELDSDIMEIVEDE